MKITFLGAAKTVTGSSYLVEGAGARFLVDCGMFQGHSAEDELNEAAFPFSPSSIDFMLLTHSHIDHSGRIPKLYVEGFRGNIHATKATAELCGLMLPDSGHIQEMENEWTNRKRQRAGKNPVKPLYTYQDAIDSLVLFRKASYGEVINPVKGIKVRFNDAGHILGSSIIELWVEEDGKETKVVFSGDLGNKGTPILRDPAIIDSTDYLVVESTYGNRVHKDLDNKVGKFLKIINETLEKGGNVVIPSFAVGRTQEIIYELNKHHEKYSKELERLFRTPVVVDSPLAASATQVFRDNLDCYDEEARAYIENGDNPLDFPGLKFTRTSDESKALNDSTESMIIISSSGMCEAGRIKHHLKHNLWRKESTILFVGYQAQGTLGRRLIEGAKRVKVFGEEISVNAKIESIEGFSGHADVNGLLEWIGSFKVKPKQVFIVHGEEESMIPFSLKINREFGYDVHIPSMGEVCSLGVLKETEKHEAAFEIKGYRRLEVIDLLDSLKEEFDELAERMKSHLKKETEDLEVVKAGEKLRNLQKAIKEIF